MPELSQEQRQQLLDKLLPCPCMATYIKRERLVQELPPAIRYKVSQSASLDTRMQVLDIVNSCLHFEDGLFELLRLVKFFDHKTSTFSALLEFLAQQGFEELVARLETLSANIGAPEKETSTLLSSPEHLRSAIKRYLELLINEDTGADDLDTMPWYGENYIPLPAAQKEPDPDVLSKRRLEQMKKSRPGSYSAQDIQMEYWLEEVGKENSENAVDWHNSKEKLDDEADYLPKNSKLVENLLEALSQHSLVALLGGPGAGKTTTLRRIAVDIAQRSLGLLEQTDTDQLDQSLPAGLLVPVYLPLGGFNVLTQSVLRLIGSALDHHVPGLGSAEIVTRLGQGQHLFYLFDGVNEMPTDTLAQSVLALRQEADKGNQRAIFACREEEFAGYFRDFTRLLVRPLGPTRIEQFVKARGAIGLLDELEGKPALRDLARTPYFLNLMCYFYDPQTDSLPDKPQLLSRPQLLSKFAHTALVNGYRRANKTVSELEIQSTLKSLGHLAYQMIEGHQGTRVEQGWAEKHVNPQALHVAALAGLVQVAWLVSSESTIQSPAKNSREGSNTPHQTVRGLRFAHQIILEWLAVKGLQQVSQAHPAQLGRILKKLALYERWEEPILLWIEELGLDESAQTEQLDTVVIELAASDLLLAQRAINLIGSRVSEKTRQQVSAKLSYLAQAEAAKRQETAKLWSVAIALQAELANSNSFSLNSDTGQSEAARQRSAAKMTAIELLLERGGNVADLLPLLSDKDEKVQEEAAYILPKLRATPAELRPLLAVKADLFITSKIMKRLATSISTVAELSDFYWLKEACPDQFEEARIQFGLAKNWQPAFDRGAKFFDLVSRIIASLLDVGLNIPFICAWLFLFGQQQFRYEGLIAPLCIVTFLTSAFQITRFNRTLGMRVMARTFLAYKDKEKKDDYWWGQGAFWVAYYLFLLDLPDLFHFVIGDATDLNEIKMKLLSFLFLLVDGICIMLTPYRQTLHDVISGVYLVRYR